MTDERPVIFRKHFMTISEINPIILLNGVETKIGDTWRRAYENNPEQRTDMANLLGENSIEYSVITQLWDS